MAPLRNRATRVQNDQDHIVAGLPVRHWRVSKARVGVPPDEHHVMRRSRWPEHPMPRDTHLLSDMSQIMLRMARLPKKQTEEPTGEPEADKKQEIEKRGKQEAVTKGFKLRKWSQMPKGFDPPDLEVLAKRRKGLPATFDNLSSLYTTVTQPTALRATKVRKTDTDGTVHVYDVMAPVGQTVEGEVPEGEEVDATTVEPPAPVGTIIDGVGIVNADGVLIAQPTPKRKAPPPRRKPKKGGPGRSKRKIVAELGPDGAPIQQPYLTADGQTNGQDGESGDTPMPDAQDGDEDDESGEEGEIMDDDDEREEGEISVETTPARPSSTLSREVTEDEAILPEGRLVSHPSGLRTEIPLETTPPPHLESPGQVPDVTEEESHMDIEMTVTETVIETEPMFDEPAEPTELVEPVVPVSIESPEPLAEVLPLIEPQPTDSITTETTEKQPSPVNDVAAEETPLPAEPAVELAFTKEQEGVIEPVENHADVAESEETESNPIPEIEPPVEEPPPPPPAEESVIVQEISAPEVPSEAETSNIDVPKASEATAEQPKSPPKESEPEPEVKDVTMSG